MTEVHMKYHVNKVDNNDVSQDDFVRSMQRAAEAQDELLRRLFGFIPQHPDHHYVDRERYIKVMNSVVQDFKLLSGDPDLVLFVFEQLSRSPRFYDDIIMDPNE
ncbi:MAG: hypothetical protein WA125_14260 [Desulfosporosinus sp.]